MNTLTRSRKSPITQLKSEENGEKTVTLHFWGVDSGRLIYSTKGHSETYVGGIALFVPQKQISRDSIPKTLEITIR